MPIRFESDLKAVAAELKTAGNVVLRGEIRAAMREQANIAKDAVAAAAEAQGLHQASENVRTRVNFTPRSAGVSIFIPSKKVPYARPLEFGSQGRSNVDRHPVFAAAGSEAYKDGKRWVNQPTRPFFVRTMRGMTAATIARVRLATTRVTTAAGFRGI